MYIVLSTSKSLLFSSAADYKFLYRLCWTVLDGNVELLPIIVTAVYFKDWN